jgi:hypothetical protein
LVQGKPDRSCLAGADGILEANPDAVHGCSVVKRRGKTGKDRFCRDASQGPVNGNNFRIHGSEAAGGGKPVFPTIHKN